MIGAVQTFGDLTKNNSSGFSALPSGCRTGDGKFDTKGADAYWWMPSEFADDPTSAWYHSLSNFGMLLFPSSKVCGMAVRIIKNN